MKRKVNRIAIPEVIKSSRMQPEESPVFPCSGIVITAYGKKGLSLIKLGMGRLSSSVDPCLFVELKYEKRLKK